MTDDRIAKGSARGPEREALGSARGGLRAAAKKAVRKVAKKAGRKKAASKASAGAGKTAGRAAASPKKAARTARSAALASGTPASGTPAATPPPAAAAGEAAAHAPKAVSADLADASGGVGRAGIKRLSEAGAGAAGPADASGSVAAATSAAPAAPSRDPGLSIDTPRPPGPMHPGAVMDSTQEQSGGLGGLLALWGPLIIVGFLVLVFRGGAEPEPPVAAGADAPGPETTAVADMGAHAPSGSPPGAAETFDGGFAMRTSMAGPPVFSGRGADAAGPAIAPGAVYPPPPGPYRGPGYRSLPTGESWSAGGPGEWMWSVEGRVGPPPSAGAGAPVRWVRCEAPYFWCPAPDRPAW